MRIPSLLRILRNVEYQVVHQDLILNDHECMGACDDGTKHIYIKKKLSRTNKIKTMLHEGLHAICFEHKINLTHEQIYQLEEALYKVLTLNKLI